MPATTVKLSFLIFILSYLNFYAVSKTPIVTRDLEGD